MFCKYCGKEIPSDSTFCKYCGRQLTKSATSETAQTKNTEQSTGSGPQTAQQQQATQTQQPQSSVQNDDLDKNEKQQGYGCLIFILILLAIVAAVFYFSNYGDSTYSRPQRTYIENTYEAFAAASVGDWYIDIHDGNKPKQVTQDDIDWSRQKLREMGKTVPPQKSTTTAKTATASTNATVATTKTVTSTSTSTTTNNSHTFALPASYSEAYSWRTNTPDKRMTALKNDSSAENLRRTNPESYIRRVAQEINKYAKNDFEKAKMAHDIVAITVAYDWAAFRSKNYPSQKGLDVLRRGTAVCDGYSRAYKAICDAIICHAKK